MGLNSQHERKDGINGTRVRSVRKLRGLSQTQLARIIGTSNGQVSTVEHGHSQTSVRAMIAIADALETSMDYLAGRVDDTRPTREIACELKTKIARVRDLEEGHAEPLDPGWHEHVGIEQIDTTAGACAGAGDGPVKGKLKFPFAWLCKHGLRAHMCRIIRVAGESMEPTVPDGCWILVDSADTERRDGKIYLITIGEELLVRRAIRDPEAGWLLRSDSRDKRTWPTRPWPEAARTVGRVRWTGRSFD